MTENTSISSLTGFSWRKTPLCQGCGILFFQDLDFATFIHYARPQPLSPVELPWLDVEQAVSIIVNQWPGDDQAVVLDYRTSRTDPRVIASEWGIDQGCCWREVSPTFSAFVQQLRL